ncbi:uridylate kinase [Schizosaccharomyces cryophilus OY26]|uniref:Uridylate kinase n=1 Tax=Schizosaccharomyces cryophilus (strain OY26 / ATCC MYA-4695 / CBS 11777 / NBRC 106824 / NRRL Y48691) TaxID=653667 RepID=S9VP39_SCHCR|nr:uridylate kinase [Schizosaccharomyces cryophilus OY26]EPY49748.1 uridylate kinase [Schizosaccharomyces cryophilus OY26]
MYKVIFVLGGPGAGKGTQCDRLTTELGCAHISAGDCLREEQARPDSNDGKLIKEYITEGKIVPMEITLRLLEAKMKSYSLQGINTFLIDGFPRKMDQFEGFERAICPATVALFFYCDQEIMLGRLMDRGKTSGRDDDNAESIKKRFVTFTETSMPVVNALKNDNRCITINAEHDPDTVFETTVNALQPYL